MAEEERQKILAEEEYQRKLLEPSETMIEEKEMFEKIQNTLYVSSELVDEIV